VRAVRPELSRVVEVGEIASGGTLQEVEANAAERMALAERLGVLEVASLTATVEVRPVRGGAAIRLDGRFEAEVVQQCVVTLEPVSAHVKHAFTQFFMADFDAGGTIDISPEDEDIEPLTDGRIDVGEAVVQQLALELDPYPRADGVVFKSEASADSDQDGPFAALKALRRPG